MGLKMRSVGQNPAAADAAGVSVGLTRYIWALIGGGICGLGGAYISLINGGGVWNNNCVNGQGWIAVALVIIHLSKNITEEKIKVVIKKHNNANPE